MEKKNKKIVNSSNLNYHRYNNTKNISNINEVNNDLHSQYKNEIFKNKIDTTYKRPNIINKIIKEDDKVINEKEKESESEKNVKETDPIQEQINKMKLENQKLKLSIQKRNKLISDLKDKCNEQHAMIKTINSKIENIKKFIPDKTIRDKENEKFEEQLAIAAVNEQIMKEICGGGSDMVGMNKIFDGGDKNKDINKKIEKIPQIYYKDNKYENPECTICFDIFKENELLKQLKCNHIFHKECLSQWLLNNSKCPICNKIC